MNNILDYLENTPHPEKIAFEDEKTALTFKDLKQQARAIGSFLAEKNIYKKPIPILMEKSPHMIAAFFGVVYSGNYYVPLDMSMGNTRINKILETTAPPLIISDNAINLEYETHQFTQIANHPINHQTLQNIYNKSIDQDPIYVVFTSGSTGTPKGVVACHRGVIDYIEELSPVLSATENAVFGNQSPLYLDACLKEIFTTLKHGAKTYLIPQSLFMFPIKLLDYINEKKITTLCWVSSALSMIAGLNTFDKNPAPQSLEVIAFGSETFPLKNLKKWQEALPQAKFIHLYGPTETTGMATYYNVPKNIESAPPIGKPFPNREIILLTQDNTPPQTGQPGEIHIRGSQLSPGYYANPTKTKESFIQNPLSPYPDTLYKTGDLAYQNENGDYIFLSRIDHQIKHMGYRIELTEIETTASSFNGVLMSCATFDSEKSRIFLYYVSSEADIVEVEQVRKFLKSNLPRYMMPYKVVRLENMPLTAGGKIDRVKLKGLL